MKHNEFFKLVDGSQIGVGHQVDLDRFVLDPSDSGEVVVPLQCRVNITCGQIVFGQLVWGNPNTHGRQLSGLDADRLDPFDGGKLRLHVSAQPVGDLSESPIIRGKANVHRRVGAVSSLDGDGRWFGVLRQFAADLLKPSIHLGESLGAAMIEFEPHGDLAHPCCTRRFHIIDTCNRRDGSLDGGGQKPSNGFCTGSYIERTDADRGAFKFWELLDRK